jgi:hypothetical protein
MKKKSSNRSAFFNLRVLIGLSIILAGISLALEGSGAFSASAASSAKAQQKYDPVGRSIDLSGFDDLFWKRLQTDLGVEQLF